MKILMINVVCGIRSTGRICTDLAEELENQGHTVKIAYGREKVPEQYKKYAVRIGNNLDVYLHALGARLFDAAGWGSKPCTKRFIKWVEDYDPDIIHLHNLHGYYINIEILFHYLKTCNKKIIWTLHDCWAFTGHCVYFDYCGCKRWKGGCYKCPKGSDYPARWIIDNSKYNYQKKRLLFTNIKNFTLVTPSEWLNTLVKQSYLKDYQVFVIHNGINTNIFKPTYSNLRQKLGLNNKKVILGVSATWEKRKGLDDFIKLDKLLDENYQIILIGVSSKLKNQLPKNILTIPKTNSPKELAEYYTMADVYVNPTYEENYPTTNLESIACGTPVITYNTGGSGESAQIYGKVIDKNEGNNIHNLLKEIIDITSKVKPLNRLNIVYELQLEKMINNYVTLYKF